MLGQLKKYRQKNADSQGFTIIEVLIVLTIGALIMLIVFLAVPALQRNSRNVQIKSNAANLLGAINEYINNNGGKMPTGHSKTALTLPVTTDLTSATEVYYGTSAVDTTTSGRINGGTVSFKTAPYSTLPTDGTLVAVIGFKCGGAGTAADPYGATVTSAKASSVVFAVETSGTSIIKCSDG